MIKHGRDSGNVINNQRFYRLKMSKARQTVDGLSNIDTEIAQILFYKTHVRLKIKTYKTTMQLEMEKLTERQKKTRVAKFLLKPGGPGLAIQQPGVVIKQKKDSEH